MLGNLFLSVDTETLLIIWSNINELQLYRKKYVIEKKYCDTYLVSLVLLLSKGGLVVHISGGWSVKIKHNFVQIYTETLLTITPINELQLQREKYYSYDTTYSRFYCLKGSW